MRGTRFIAAVTLRSLMLVMLLSACTSKDDAAAPVGDGEPIGAIPSPEPAPVPAPEPVPPPAPAPEPLPVPVPEPVPIPEPAPVPEPTPTPEPEPIPEPPPKTETPAPNALATMIAVTRGQCTPFGNAPRPRKDASTEWLNNQTMCSSGGARLPGWTDANGTPRAACLFDAGNATPEHPLPLVVYLQASNAFLDGQVEATGLLAGLTSANLTGDPDRPGFLLLAPLGRFTDHYYPRGNDTGTVGWDVWYRQFLPGAPARSVNDVNYPLNPDFATLDHYIAEQVATGKVDPQRIYIFGWSAGASLALQYGQNRREVAGVAMYSGPNPYAFLDDPCAQTPVAGAPLNDSELQVFNPQVPVFHIVNSCDLYAICPNSQQLRDTLNLTGTALFQHQLINGVPQQQATDSCDAICGTDPNGEPFNPQANSTGGGNHGNWPHGWTERWYSFLREHPRQAN